VLSTNKQKSSVILSIVIPVYNRQKSLDQLIDKLSFAIEQGRHQDTVEIIIIDDCSQPPVLKPKLSCHSQFKRNIKNLGAPLSRKAGYQLAQGKFIHFHDSDDSVPEDWLDKILQELNKTPQTELLLTWRLDVEKHNGKIIKKIRKKPFFYRNIKQINTIKKRLNYDNIIGPLGGVTFSKKSLNNISFNNIASSQDWLMYIEVMQRAKYLTCCPNNFFIFNKAGTDRISHNPRKKILGFLQLAKSTQNKTPFGRNIRFFYLYRSRYFIKAKGGAIARYYKKNQLRIFITYLVIAGYSFLP
jgi:glycosyltransferase involved in cell wall biosynthesis